MHSDIYTISVGGSSCGLVVDNTHKYNVKQDVIKVSVFEDLKLDL